MHYRTVFLTALIACLPSLAPAAQTTEERLLAADREPGSWLAHGRNYGEERFSPLKQVNAENVAKLGLAWNFKYPLDRVVEATPIVVDGVLYTTSAYSIVFALDAVTGELLSQ